MARILVVDDEEGIRSFLAAALTRDGDEIVCAADGDEAAAMIDRLGFDVIITDLKMPGRGGIALLAKVRAEMPDAQVILLTAHATVDTAVEAMKAGAFDYVQKPVESPAALRMLVNRAIERRQLLGAREGSNRAQAAALPPLTYGDPAMAAVKEALEKVARTNATVLLLGETGTGKEIAARIVHADSARSGHPFVAVNCAALSDTLLESELFGHERGAFTGAHAQHRGRIELAEGGTFFLDEIGELKLDVQAKLLRVLQERRFERIGGTRTLTADVRWIAATNRDLRAMIAAGTFREDLYHRLAVFPIRMPALRERRGDLRALVGTLLQAAAAELGRPRLRLSAEAESLLDGAELRGNIRELKNVLERAAILADDGVVRAEHIWIDPPSPARLASTDGRLSDPGAPRTEGSVDSRPPPDPAAGTLESAERIAIERALTESAGNRRRAADRLGIGLRTLYEKLKRYGLG
jgi:two-component system, NtrC family, response regulator AtoC